MAIAAVGCLIFASDIATQAANAASNTRTITLKRFYISLSPNLASAIPAAGIGVEGIPPATLAPPQGVPPGTVSPIAFVVPTTGKVTVKGNVIQKTKLTSSGGIGFIPNSENALPVELEQISTTIQGKTGTSTARTTAYNMFSGYRNPVPTFTLSNLNVVGRQLRGSFALAAPGAGSLSQALGLPAFSPGQAFGIFLAN